MYIPFEHIGNGMLFFYGTKVPFYGTAVSFFLFYNLITKFWRYSMANMYGYQPQFTTNKNYVTSVEDALARFASPNTIMVYFMQDESGVVEITTDMYGKKYAKVRPYVKETTKQPTDFITRAEFDELNSKFERLSKKGVKDNDEVE